MDHQNKGKGRDEGRKPVSQVHIAGRKAMMFSPPDYTSRRPGEGMWDEESVGTDYDAPIERWAEDQLHAQGFMDMQSSGAGRLRGVGRLHDNESGQFGDVGRPRDSRSGQFGDVGRLRDSRSGRPSDVERLRDSERSDRRAIGGVDIAGGPSSHHGPVPGPDSDSTSQSDMHQLYPKPIKKIFEIAAEMTGCRPESLVLTGEAGARATTVDLADFLMKIEEHCGESINNITMVSTSTYNALISDYKKMVTQNGLDETAIEMKDVQIRDLERRRRAHRCDQGVITGR